VETALVRLRVLLAPLLAALCLAGCGGGESTRQPEKTRTGPVADLTKKLEENQRTLPKDTSSEAPLPQLPVVELVRRYQTAGFFRGERPSEAAVRIQRAYERIWGDRVIAPKTRGDELALIAADRRQAWFEDIERDVIEGNDEYVAAFHEWARISRGAFNPSRIREHWRGPDGPVDIEYTLGGRRHVAHARGLGDFLDLCVLTRDVNRSLSGSRRFELYRPDAALGQDAFVAALTPIEKRRLERFGWRFATADQVGLVFAYGRVYEHGETTGCGK
jgi:hypothetical protein